LRYKRGLNYSLGLFLTAPYQLIRSIICSYQHQVFCRANRILILFLKHTTSFNPVPTMSSAALQTVGLSVTDLPHAPTNFHSLKVSDTAPSAEYHALVAQSGLKLQPEEISEAQHASASGHSSRG
jgi:hypothetical protein